MMSSHASDIQPSAITARPLVASQTWLALVLIFTLVISSCPAITLASSADRLDGTNNVQNTGSNYISVFLPRLDLSDGETILIPNGRPVYAFLVSGYHQNEQLDMFHFYNFAKCILEKGGYVHYSWWNNLLAPYMAYPLHDLTSEPGNFADLDFLGFIPLLDLAVQKANPEEDYQFQFDLKNVLNAIRDHNPQAVIVLVGHSMGGDAVARFGASTSHVIDLLAPIDPVGNRTCMQWDDPDSPECLTPGFLFQNTRFRATHEDLLLDPEPRKFESNIRYLYYRWQQEGVPPFDWEFPLPGLVLNCPYDGADPDYLFEHPDNRACGIGQGSTNVQSKMQTSVFSGCDLDPRWWICPDVIGGFIDGHGEIVGFRGFPWTTGFDSALKASGNWPSWDLGWLVERVHHMQQWEADPEYLEQQGFAPANAGLCKVSGDLCAILDTILGQGPAQNLPPVSDANGPYETECGGTTTTVFLDGSGSSDPEGADLTYLWQTSCPGGNLDDAISVTTGLAVDTSECLVECIAELTVTDPAGSQDIATTPVTITDSLSPAASCAADTVISCDETTDPGNTGKTSATDVCDPGLDIAFGDMIIAGGCQQEYTIKRTWTATDYCGNSDGCVQTIEVTDTSPPVISSVTATPDILWPPDHRMKPVTVTTVAVDNCGPEPVCEIVSVHSNEPANAKGDGNTAEDWQLLGGLTMELRAERSGDGSGREYEISVRCTDACGNSATDTTYVSVPHDRGKQNKR